MAFVVASSVASAATLDDEALSKRAQGIFNPLPKGPVKPSPSRLSLRCFTMV